MKSVQHTLISISPERRAKKEQAKCTWDDVVDTGLDECVRKSTNSVTTESGQKRK